MPRRASVGKAPASAAAHALREAPGCTNAVEVRRTDDEEELDDDESDEEDLTDGYGPSGRDARGNLPAGHSVRHSVSMSTGIPRSQQGAVSAAVGKAYLPVEALELPVLEVLPLNHTHAMRFRTMTLDAKTQQAYLRDKKDVNRSQKYQCLVCAVNHDFRLSKFANAEHQHA